ncbi:MbnP family copper-binding protein [Alteromonas gracilis]|uniref:MbnP family copper-binding protein n=1 Tax=Alteromonas gracilis TaxID=1479524 RepID=UPI003734DC42
MKMPFRIMPTLLLAALFSLTGCDTINFKGREAGEIPFKLVGVDTGACPMIMSIGQQRWNIDYFGFYLSKPEVRIDGKWQQVKFKQTQWQTANVALLKFHSKCANPDKANSKILLDVSQELLKLATNLRFTMGLPFDDNHANPVSQPSPLNDSSMFWSRQNGHKFLRLDVSKTGEKAREWSYQLGSVGCDSEDADMPPEKSCAFTNRVEFILPMTQLDTDLDLEISVSNIVAQVDINEAPSCIFESPETAPCEKLIENLVHRPWIKWQ